MNCPNVNSILTNTHIIDERRDVVSHRTLCQVDFMKIVNSETCHGRAERLSCSETNAKLLDVTKENVEMSPAGTI